jgi:SAM-dependent methyltransferase/uncharacterized protein YbaR (Trm112 family)
MMNEGVLKFLRCPSCRGSLRLVIYEGEPSINGISSGLLLSRCGAKYPIWRGVPRMLMPHNRIVPPEYLERFRDRLLSEAPELLAEVSGQNGTRGYSFDTQWSMYEYGELTWELDLATRVKYFYDYLRIEPGSLNGMLVLDAGCGNGTLTAGIGANGPEIIGIDYSESVERAENEKGRFAAGASSRVHFVQGDVQHPPFAPDTFDVIYSDGVLHHTPNTEASFSALAPLVKQGGRYFVWLYRSDLSPIFKMKLTAAKTLQSILRPLPLPVLKYLCFSGAAILLLRLRFLRLLGNRKRRIVPLKLKAVNLFDTLTPRFYHLHTPVEVREWFTVSGFPNPVETSISSLSHGGFGMMGQREREAQTVLQRTASSSSV